MMSGFRNYTTGFVASVFLTLVAYILVADHVDSGHTEHRHNNLVFWIISLAIIQLIVQAVFFLHLGSESKPRWNLMSFLFMLMVVVIVVAGSLWIMNNLDYHHGHDSPNQIENEIFEQEAIPKESHD